VPQLIRLFYCAFIDDIKQRAGMIRIRMLQPGHAQVAYLN